METYIFLSVYYYFFDIVNIKNLSFSFLSWSYKVPLLGYTFKGAIKPQTKSVPCRRRVLCTIMQSVFSTHIVFPSEHSPGVRLL